MIDIGRGVKLVRRSEAGLRAPRSASSFTPSFGSTCHWEGPRMGTFPHASCATKVRVIQDFHMDARGWQDIAYTAVVCPHGYVFEGRWVRRRTAANGTNTGNSRAYAICYLGGQTDPWTPAGQRAMRAALDWLDAHGGAGPGRNGHRDWKPTECPGDAIYRWVRAGQAAGSPAPSPTPAPQEGFLMGLTDHQQQVIHDSVLRQEKALAQFFGTGDEYLGGGETVYPVSPTAQDLLDAARTTGYLAKVKGAAGGASHWVPGDHAKGGAVKLSVELRAWITSLLAISGLPTAPVEVDADVLAELVGA